MMDSLESILRSARGQVTYKSVAYATAQVVGFVGSYWIMDEVNVALIAENAPHWKLVLCNFGAKASSFVALEAMTYSLMTFSAKSEKSFKERTKRLFSSNGKALLIASLPKVGSALMHYTFLETEMVGKRAAPFVSYLGIGVPLGFYRAYLNHGTLWNLPYKEKISSALASAQDWSMPHRERISAACAPITEFCKPYLKGASSFVASLPLAPTVSTYGSRIFRWLKT